MCDYWYASGVAGKKPRRGTIPRGHLAGPLAKPQGLSAGSLERAKPWGDGVGLILDLIQELILASNRGRVTASERAYGVLGGVKPRRENPKSGTGMKQAQQVARGAKRRRGAKPQGRNLTREVEAHGR